MTNEFLFTSQGKNDECYTHRYGVEPLLEFLPRFKDKIIWCPFDDEESEFVKCFREDGYKIVNSHIRTGQDFYFYEPEEWDLIVSNPPFTNKKEIFKRAIGFNKPFCLLMSLTWLNDSTLKKLLRDKGLQLLMFEERMTFKCTAAFNARNKESETQNKINFSSAYYCRDFLPEQIVIRDFKANQGSLF